MSKRPSPDAGRSGNFPPPKKARYSYDPELMQQRTLPRMSMTTNSDDETVSETEQHVQAQRPSDNVLLKSTNDPIKSNLKIHSEIMVAKSEGDWCPVQWFRNRVYHQDAEEFFNILPYDETNGVAKPLLMFQGGSITLTKNIINTLDTMQKITQFIHNQSCSAPNKHNKRKKRFLREQNEIFNTFNVDKLRKDNENYINKIQKDIIKFNNINNDYVAYENERKLIWKSSNNNNNNCITPTPPPPPPTAPATATANNNKLLNIIDNKVNKINKLNVALQQHSDFVSSSDHESDEDFTIFNDDGNVNDFYSSSKRKNKKKKKKKKKSKRQKLEAEIARERERELALKDKEMYGDGGKNPAYGGDTQPTKFWDKFGGYFEPINTSQLEEIIPHLQSDIFPRQIPSLPLEKSFVNKSYNFDNYNHAIAMDDDINDDAFDMEDMMDNSHNTAHADIKNNINDENNENDNELYFAEMPLHYEYFLNKKCYIDEQHNIESDKNGKYLRKDVMYENYPHKSLFGHSFDQRTLSGIVHECNGMYHIENPTDENYWRKIGKNKSKNDVEMIEPIIKYKKMECDSKDSKDGIITFEKALRNEICDNLFGGKREEIDKIVSMPWHERLDDECSAVIKSLTNNLETTCYEHAPNDIETNVKIAMQIIQMIQVENETNTNNYHSWQELNGHIHQLQKHYIETDGAFGIDQNTLAQPQWSQYFKEKQSLSLNQAVQAFMQKNHVRTDV